MTPLVTDTSVLGGLGRSLLVLLALVVSLTGVFVALSYPLRDYVGSRLSRRRTSWVFGLAGLVTLVTEGRHLTFAVPLVLMAVFWVGKRPGLERAKLARRGDVQRVTEQVMGISRVQDRLRQDGPPPPPPAS